jgi:hypothetical protein
MEAADRSKGPTAHGTPRAALVALSARLASRELGYYALHASSGRPLCQCEQRACSRSGAMPFASPTTHAPAPVFSEYRCVGLRSQLVDQLGRALDVGEEEGDGTGK